MANGLSGFLTPEMISRYYGSQAKRDLFANQANPQLTGLADPSLFGSSEAQFVFGNSANSNLYSGNNDIFDYYYSQQTPALYGREHLFTQNAPIQPSKPFVSSNAATQEGIVAQTPIVPLIGGSGNQTGPDTQGPASDYTGPNFGFNPGQALSYGLGTLGLGDKTSGMLGNALTGMATKAAGQIGVNALTGAPIGLGLGPLGMLATGVFNSGLTGMGIEALGGPPGRSAVGYALSLAGLNNAYAANQTDYASAIAQDEAAWSQDFGSLSGLAGLTASIDSLGYANDAAAGSGASAGEGIGMGLSSPGDFSGDYSSSGSMGGLDTGGGWGGDSGSSSDGGGW